LKICPKCNQQYSDREKFCRRDGSRLDSLDAAPASESVHLTIQATDGKVRDVVLEKSSISIGASSENALVIEDKAASRVHARIIRNGNKWVLVDNRSTNGVFLNGKRIGADEVPLHDGDEILIGRTKIRFNEKVAAPEPPPAPPAAIEVKPPEASPAAPKLTLLDGRYELLDPISQDALGTLYKARRVALGDMVAVRVLKPSLVNNAIALERFRRQALVAARIHHPNAVQIFDFVQSPDGQVYIVEELLEGRTLRDVIASGRGLTLAQTVGLFNQIGGAVHAAHLNGIVLRDLRPEYIHIEETADGKQKAKISGTGLARLDPSAGSGMTMAGIANVVGAGQYMSPEQWMGQPLDSRSDVYSLGVILFEVLTGSVPFDARSRQEIAELHLKAQIPDIADRGRPDLDESINAVITRALEKNPNLRPPTAIDFAQEFEAVAGVHGGVLGNFIRKATGILPIQPVIISAAPAPPRPGEVSLPPVVAQAEEKGEGAFNVVVLALMAEAFLSRVSGGLLKMAVPLYALLVFGLDITVVMPLFLVQNIVPLLLRPFFGSMADRYGKKRIFLLSLIVRTIVGLIYVFASLPLLFFASVVRGIADSAKGPSASAMIADHTNEKHLARAYSWYTTTKSTSGSIGETLAVWLIPFLVGIFIASQTVNVTVATYADEKRPNVTREKIIADVNNPIELQGKPAIRIEAQQKRLYDVPLEDMPKVVDKAWLKRTLIIVFFLSSAFSAISVVLVAIFIKDKKKEKGKKKTRESKDKVDEGQELVPAAKAPSVWAFAFMGTLLTAPGYMVTGEFFIILAIKLAITAKALAWIKLIAEMIIPLFFGPFFGWIADRIGVGKVIALRSLSNIATSILFWIAASFSGTALFAILLGVARGLDEVGKAAFKPMWGAVSARISSFNLGTRARTMGILEAGVDTSDLLFPQIAGLLFAKLGLPILMIIRGVLAIAAEIYTALLMKKTKI